jgi:hypothetical protein
MPTTLHVLLAAAALVSGAVDPAPPTAPPIVREAVALEPTGTSIPLGGEPDTVVDPSASFRVELAGSLADARLVLLDALDAHVAASAAQEVASTTRLTLAPTAPLTPGSRYTLRVEGASTREAHDAAGKAYAPVSMAILAAGAPPPPDQKRKPQRKRRAHQGAAH